MTIGMRVAVTLAAFATTVPLAACGGGDAGSEMRLTLTEAYEGDETLAAGMFTVEVENQTSNSGAFALAAIAGGATVDDLEAFLEEARQQFQQGGGLPDPPAFYSQVVRVAAGAGTSSLLPADVPAGTYALTCFIDDPPIWRGYLAGQLDLTQ